MAIQGFNPAQEMAMIRSQQTLAMQGAAGPAPAGAPDAAAAMAQAAAQDGAAGDAGMAAQAVQPQPPQSSKIILQSVLKGASTGASVALGFKQFGPLLGKIPFLKGPFAAAGGFLTKLPIVGKLLGKTGIQGFLMAGLVGAGIGAAVGAFQGFKKAKTAASEYEAAMAAAQQQAPQQPDAMPGAPAPAPGSAKPNPEMKPGTPGGRKARSWIIARSGQRPAPGGKSFGHYNVKRGDTLGALAKRFHTTVAELARLNQIADPNVIPVGMKLKVQRKVFPPK